MHIWSQRTSILKNHRLQSSTNDPYSCFGKSFMEFHFWEERILFLLQFFQEIFLFNWNFLSILLDQLINYLISIFISLQYLNVRFFFHINERVFVFRAEEKFEVLTESFCSNQIVTKIIQKNILFHRCETSESLQFIDKN